MMAVVAHAAADTEEEDTTATATIVVILAAHLVDHLTAHLVDLLLAHHLAVDIHLYALLANQDATHLAQHLVAASQLVAHNLAAHAPQEDVLNVRLSFR